MLFDNSGDNYELIAKGTNKQKEVFNNNKWELLKKKYGQNK